MSEFFARLLARLGAIWQRVLDGKEPVAVAWLVGLIITIAAQRGLDLDESVIWTFLAIVTPGAATARNKVDPSVNKLTWWQVLSGMLNSKPDIDLSEDDGDPAGDPISLAVDGEPEWLDEYLAMNGGEE